MLRSRILSLALVLGVVLTLTQVTAQARPAPIGQDAIVAGQPYHGDFPDPWIVRVGPHYYAYSTTSDGLNVPMLSSSDLRTWVARPPTATDPTGDALPRTAVWSAGRETSDGRLRATTWAPAVTRLAPHDFVLAYATEVAGSTSQRMCISLARSASPYGPFVDQTSTATVCPLLGAIDPQIYIAPSGRPWLIWKGDHFPARLFTAPMNRAATALVPGQPVRFLAKVALPWEGSIIENPAMIRFHKRFYLFYSANSYTSTRYAIGYLICKSWRGPCKRPTKYPLLHTGGLIAGPGGPAPFFDTRGRLRLGYHAWTAGTVGYPTSDACLTEVGGCGQRRLYVATLGLGKHGKLKVVRRY